MNEIIYRVSISKDYIVYRFGDNGRKIAKVLLTGFANPIPYQYLILFLVKTFDKVAYLSALNQRKNMMRSLFRRGISFI